MATFNPDELRFILDPTEITFAIPATIGDRPTPEQCRILGNDLNNVLIGDATNNWIDGGRGDDTLIGGLGADKFIGGEGFDTVSYASSGAGVSVDLGRTVIVALIGDDTDTNFTSVEGVIGSAFADVIIGTDKVSERLDGGVGNDHIRGGGGNDTLIGGLGADILEGGAGDDVYEIDSNSDIVIESATGGTDVVYTSVSWTMVAHVENLIASGTGALALTGNDLSNRIVGNSAANVLNGGGGADILEGGLGNDVYYIESLSDTVIETASGGIDLVHTSMSWIMAAHVENVTANAATAMTLIGNALNNAITGNNGRDTLRGNAGADTLSGGLGNDKLYGGAGKDVFVFDTAGHKSRNKDTIHDWKYRDDTIRLDKGIFKKLPKGTVKSKYFTLGDKAKDGNDYLGVNKKTGDVWYDKNGDKAGGQVIFANIGKNKAIFASDFFVF